MGIQLKFTHDHAQADLDKAWHGLHFLLTGTDWEGEPPLNFLTAGGTPLEKVDAGYGPARVYCSSEVYDLNNALDQVKEENLRQRFDADVMMEQDIYPRIWARDPKDDNTLGYLIERFQVMKAFVEQAAKRNLGMLIFLC